MEAERTIEAGLIEEAARDLDWLVENVPLRATDAVNRAITIYAYLEQVQREGAELHIQYRNGATERWTFK